MLLENIQHIPELKKLYLNGNRIGDDNTKVESNTFSKYIAGNKTPTNKWKKQIASNHPNKELVVQI